MAGAAVVRLCILLLTVTRGWAPFGVILRQPKLLGWTALAGLLIYINWQVFLIGTLSDNVVETSLGYFINPITTVLLGVFVLKERIRRLQWAAIAIAAIAVVVIIVAYRAFPWIALSLTASFGVYGLIKKKIGPAVDAVSGLTLESFWLIPIAVVQLIVVATTPAGITMGGNGWVHAVLLPSRRGDGRAAAAVRGGNPSDQPHGDRDDPVHHPGDAVPHRRRDPARADAAGSAGPGSSSSGSRSASSSSTC